MQRMTRISQENLRIATRAVIDKSEKGDKRQIMIYGQTKWCYVTGRDGVINYPTEAAALRAIRRHNPELTVSSI